MRLVVLVLLLSACGEQLAASDGGGQCVDIQTTAFDTSCNADPDCVAVYAGNLCAGYNCICPTGAINTNSETAYYANLSKVPKGTGPMCQCPAFGTPRCVASQCVFCPNPALNPSSYPPGCPDGGP